MAVLLAAFTALALFYTGVSYFIVVILARAEFHLKNILIFNTIEFYLWVALAPLIIALARRHPVTRDNWIGPFFIHLCSCFPCALLEASLTIFLFWLIRLPVSREIYPDLSIAVQSMGQPFALGVIIYWTIALAAYSVEYYRRYQREELRRHQLQTQLAQAQLQALKMQLQPHFLFNTLHSIIDLVLEDAEAATRMITRLGDFLRLTLDSPTAPTIPLRQELDYLNCYLEIEKLRFQDRLLITIDIEPEVLSAQVPNFILQPLVENAIRHGVAARLGKSRVGIKAKRRGDRLEIEVQNDGNGAEARQTGQGIGLGNTRQRLNYLYGDNQSLDLARAGDSHGTIVSLVIPFAAPTSSNAT